jgi:hypothetical protein
MGTVRLNLARPGPWIGAEGMLRLLWLYLASVLFAPWWGVAMMLVMWLLVGLLVLGWAHIHPARAAVTPLIGLVRWLAIVSAGDAWRGWSA